MATPQVFRRDIINLLVAAIFGNSASVGAGKFEFREARNSYDEDPKSPRRSVVLAAWIQGDVAGYLSDPDDALATLQPGEKTFQMRMWLQEEDREQDSNIPALVAAVEIEVHRVLMFPSEEYFYASDEMLYNQQNLLDKSLWEARVSLHSLVEGPAITDVPTREGNVIKYTVAATAVIQPD